MTKQRFGISAAKIWHFSDAITWKTAMSQTEKRGTAADAKK
jgi:hypothetical protein